MEFSFQPAAVKEQSTFQRAYSFEQIPEDVLINILMRLSAKSLMRFKCVSKLWSFLISSRYFTNVFHKTRPPRRLFTYTVNKRKPCEYKLLSASPNPNSIFVLDHVLNMPVLEGYFVSAIRGLLCVSTEKIMQICNLTTKQLVELELPTICKENVWNYFGYDHVRDEYKVLNIVWELSNDGEEKVVRSSEYHVLVLGTQASWRSTQSSFVPPPHLPCTKGISIDGVLYYRAQIDDNDGTFVVMSFDLTSEDFSLIKKPLDVISRLPLMNYQGKIALFEYSQTYPDTGDSVDIWTLDDAEKSIWSNKKSFVLPCFHMNFMSFPHVWMQGTNRSGEFWLGKTIFDGDTPILFVSYDLETNNIATRIEMNQWFCEPREAMHLYFWDDMESIMYLET